MHNREIADPYTELNKDYINRSALGYIWVYNMLPEGVARHSSTKAFQSALQRLVKSAAEQGVEEWPQLLSA